MKKLLIQENGENMNLAILQARMSSRRLPGKVLLPIQNKPMLLREIERIQKSKLINKLIVATSNAPEDDAIEKMCQDNGVLCYRGSLNNVLERFQQISALYNPTNIIRITGDCPLIDAEIIDQVIIRHVENNNDYTSNAIIPTFPDGLDTEIFKREVLEHIFKQANKSSLKEHVTLYVHENPDLFKIENVSNSSDLSNQRWTVDELEDYEFIRVIYDHLYPENPSFSYEDIVSFLNEHPQYLKINDRFSRNEGLIKSLEADNKI